MTDPKNEVLFCEYCKTCKHKLCDCEDEPCCDCLAAPVNYYSHKPVNWEGVDTLFNKPVERRDHAAERAVREALCLDCSDIADVLEAGSTPRTKINKNSILSEIVQMVKDKYGRDFTWEELTGILGTLLSYDDEIMESTYDAQKFSGDYYNGKITEINEIHFNEYTESNTGPGYKFSDSKSLFNNITGVYLPNVRKINARVFMECDKLSTIYAPNVEYIGYSAFYECRKLTSIDLPKLTTVDGLAFRGCYRLATVNLPKLVTVNERAFYSCENLKEVFLPSVTYLGEQALAGTGNSGDRSGLETISAPKCLEVDNYCFSDDYRLINVDLPLVETVGDSAFMRCTSLTTIKLPALKNIPGSSSFAYCYWLESVDFPSLEVANYSSTFKQCTHLKEVKLPKVQILGHYTFSECSSLTEIELPSLTTIGKQAFTKCTKLKTVTLPKINKFYTDVFNSCTALELIDLSGISAMPGNIDTDAFVSIPKKCVIRVPVAFYIQFITHKVISGIKDQVVYTGEARHIRTTITNGHATLNDVPDTYVDNDFVIEKGASGTAKFYPGADSTIIEATDNGADITSNMTYTPSKTMSREYRVEPLEKGATYSFALNSDGYYESQSKGIKNSYAMCRIVFNVEEESSVILKVINSGEASYDYGGFSLIDTAYPNGNTDGTMDTALSIPENLSQWTGKQKNSTDVVDVPYTIPAGEHFIEAKYRKDSSKDVGNDSLQFQVTWADSGITKDYYTYTLENIQADHDIVVTFGDAETKTT